VTIGIIRTVGGETVWVDTRRYEPIEHLVVSVDWQPSGDRLVYQVQDREQTWLDLNAADPDTGSSATWLHETSPAFVQQLGDPYWLADGGFLWFSERTGFKHLYRYSVESDGAVVLQNAVTAGEWEARTLHGVAADGQVYVSGTERSPIGGDVYRVALDGTGLARLSQREGTHRASFNDAMTLYVDSWSDVRTPTQVRLHDASGAELRVIDDNPAPELAALRLGETEFLRVPTRDGFTMEAQIIRPPDFDPSQRYPVLQYNYGGPHAPSVRNAWGGTTYLWHQMLAQKGYIIWICDNRSASGKGIAPTWEAYGQMGVVELRDIEDGVTWLRSQPWVDGDRIGIHGWSYGGFMASYALTHSTSFRAGIAGAPVTDWRLYDSIYTERYMRMPQNNPEGYAATSVVEAAADLSGALMIIHGTMDDNVHTQNSIQLIYALQKAGKEFEVMIYPRSRHGVREPELVYHLRRGMTEFLLENL
jgi:dipeptidyl-peptidase-4